jgi:tetratricopeptide (TPR) repeat protein
MKFGFRMPSLTKRAAARVSFKRMIRHSVGIKAPRGFGLVTNPRKAIYNHVYNHTSFGLNSLIKHSVKARDNVQEREYTAPISSRTNNVIVPLSLIKIINSPNPFNKILVSKIGIVLGVLILGGNPIVGIAIIGGSWYWLNQLSKIPTNIYNIAISKAKKLFKKDKAIEAIPILRDAINEGADSPEISYLFGAALFINEDMNLASEYLQKYYDQHKEDTDIKLLLAQNYYKIKEPAKVVQLLNMFPEEHPNHGIALLLLGKSFYELQEYEVAINTFKRAPLRKQKLDDYLLDIHYHIGVAYQKLGKKTFALKHLNKVYAFDTEYRDVKTLITTLDKDLSLQSSDD